MPWETMAVVDFDGNGKGVAYYAREGYRMPEES
jgi:hypothetical protein